MWCLCTSWSSTKLCTTYNHVLSISHTTLLLRNAFMESSIANVFDGVPVSYVEDYKMNYGIVYELNGHILSSTTSLIVIVCTIVVLSLASMILFKRKYN